MLNYRRKLLTAVGGAVAAAALAVTGITAASAAPATSGTEHMQVMSTSTTSNTASVIAYGVFTDAGTANLTSAKVTTFKLAHGTVTVTHKQTKGTHHFNSKTCLGVINQSGTYKITGGTGSYAGISGSGTYQLSALFVGAKTQGKCSMTKAPVAQQQLLKVSGPTTL
jgi:hypothetical protein